MVVAQDMHNYGFSGLHKLSLCKKKRLWWWHKIWTITDSVDQQGECDGDTWFAILLTEWITQTNSVKKQAVVVRQDLHYY